MYIKKYFNNKVYLFGAHVFSQYLLHSALVDFPIVSILDNDPEKQGKRLYGTNIKVESPLSLSKIDAPVVILRAGVYNKEISCQLQKINSSIVII